MTCYLYRDGEQFWLIGNDIYLGDRYEFREMIVTKGTGYGRDFNPAKVERIVWGDIIMRLQDCNNARFELRPDGEQQIPPFTTQMTRIVAGNCNLSASQQISRVLTGNYFAPGRSGEGIQLAREANGSAWVVTRYTYREGHQVWVIGSGEMIDVHANRNLGALLSRNDRAEEAEPLLRKAYKLAPEDVGATLGLAECLLELGAEGGRDVWRKLLTRLV